MCGLRSEVFMRVLLGILAFAALGLDLIGCGDERPMSAPTHQVEYEGTAPAASLPSPANEAVYYLVLDYQRNLIGARRILADLLSQGIDLQQGWWPPDNVPICMNPRSATALVVLLDRRDDHILDLGFIRYPDNLAVNCGVASFDHYRVAP